MQRRAPLLTHRQYDRRNEPFECHYVPVDGVVEAVNRHAMQEVAEICRNALCPGEPLDEVQILIRSKRPPVFNAFEQETNLGTQTTSEKAI